MDQSAQTQRRRAIGFGVFWVLLGLVMVGLAIGQRLWLLLGPAALVLVGGLIMLTMGGRSRPRG